MNSRIIGCLVLLTACVAWCQSTSTNTQSGQVLTSQNIPKYVATFSDAQPIQGVAVSEVMTGPSRCSSDGAVYLEWLQPPNYTQRKLYSVSASGAVHPFDIENIPGLLKVEPIEFYAGIDTLAYFVYAQEDESPNSTDSQPKTGNYIVVYNLDGSYKRKVHLNVPFTLQNFAELGDREFLVLGYDPGNRVRLALVDSDGSYLHDIALPLDISTQFASNPNAASAYEAKASNMVEALGFIQFLPYGKDVLLIQNDTRRPVYELNQGGVYRSIPLEIPKGLVLGSFIPSEKNWFVRVMKPKKGPHMSYDSLFEINPLDGHIIRQITTSLWLDDIMCAANGDLIGMHLKFPSSGPPVPMIVKATLR